MTMMPEGSDMASAMRDEMDRHAQAMTDIMSQGGAGDDDEPDADDEL